MENVKLHKSGKRNRILTPDSSGSFYSCSTLSPVSFNAKNFEFFDLSDSSLFFDSIIEAEMSNKLHKLYFKVDKKISKINEWCVQVLKKVEFIQNYKAQINLRIRNFEGNESLRAIDLLEDQGKVEELERKVDDFEEYVRDCEIMNETQKKLLEDVKEETRRSKSSYSEAVRVKEEIVKYSALSKKLNMHIKELNYQKGLLVNDYNYANKQGINFLLPKMALDDCNLKINALDERNNRRYSDILAQQQNNKKLEDSVLNHEMKNCELNEEITKELEALEQKLHSNAIRNQWLAGYKSDIDSKKAMNRVMLAQINAKLEKNKKKMQQVSVVDTELDVKILRLEIEETQLRKNEKEFSQKLSKILKAPK